MEDRTAYYELKTKIHTQLLNTLDLVRIETMDKDTLRQGVKSLAEKILMQERTIPLNFSEREKLFQEIQDEVVGLGPLEPFMQDPTISDVLVNNYKLIYIERFGKLELTEARFKDEAHLRKIIDKIVSAVGRRVDESSPMVDARLEDGSRVNAIIPPLALDGSALSIRRFAVEPLEIADLLKFKTMSPEIAKLLEGIVQARLNTLISGGTGTGKTTLLNVLSRFIPETERIITVEDSAELQLKQRDIIRLESRPANIEGRGEVTQKDLVRNTLRMRPDRIIVGEVRGDEVLPMLYAMNTGHDGSLSTLHANSPRDALARLETLIAMSGAGGANIPITSTRKYLSSALNVIIHLSRLLDGTRKIVSIQEITGMEGDVITMQEIFEFQQTGVNHGGNIHGKFKATGVRPRWVEKFKAMGIPVCYEIFDTTKVFEV